MILLSHSFILYQVFFSTSKYLSNLSLVLHFNLVFLDADVETEIYKSNFGAEGLREAAYGRRKEK